MAIPTVYVLIIYALQPVKTHSVHHVIRRASVVKVACVEKGESYKMMSVFRFLLVTALLLMECIY